VDARSAMYWDWRCFLQPISHGGAVLIKLRVHTGDNDVHLFEHRVGEVERAITRMSTSTPAKMRMPFIRFSTARILSMCASARSSVRPLAKARFFE